MKGHQYINKPNNKSNYPKVQRAMKLIILEAIQAASRAFPSILLIKMKYDNNSRQI